MTIRNLVIAAGAVIAAGSAFAAPAMAQDYNRGYQSQQSAYGYDHNRYEQRTYEAAPVAYGYGHDRDRFEHRGWEQRRYWEQRREQERRAEWLRNHRHHDYRRYY